MVPVFVPWPGTGDATRKKLLRTSTLIVSALSGATSNAKNRPSAKRCMRISGLITKLRVRACHFVGGTNRRAGRGTSQKRSLRFMCRRQASLAKKLARRANKLITSTGPVSAGEVECPTRLQEHQKGNCDRAGGPVPPADHPGGQRDESGNRDRDVTGDRGVLLARAGGGDVALQKNQRGEPQQRPEPGLHARQRRQTENAERDCQRYGPRDRFGQAHQAGR